MTRQTITPRDREHWLSLRAQDLTSTDVAALFGMSPYKTKFELWHEKRSGERVRIAQNDRAQEYHQVDSLVCLRFVLEKIADEGNVAE